MFNFLSPFYLNFPNLGLSYPSLLFFFNFILVDMDTIYIFKDLFIFREWKGGRKRGREHHCVVASHMPPTGDLA